MKEKGKALLTRILFVGGLVIFTVLATLYAFPTQWAKVGVKGFGGEYKLGLDLQGGAHLVYETDMSNIAESDRTEALEGVRDVVERRVNAFGVSEPLVQTNKSGDTYRLIVELAGVFDIKQAIASIGETPILEFKLPVKDVKTEATPEQEKQIADAQATERKAALDVLSRAKSKEDFAALAKEFSVDASTKDEGGYVGFVGTTDQTFDGLIAEIQKKKYKPGIIPGLYESTSAIHIVDYKGVNLTGEAKLSHILICYDGASKCTNARTKEEAQALATKLSTEATKVSFAQLAQDNSDDSGSGKNGGDLGWVSEGMMVEPFQAGYLALKDGQISGVIETDFGFHVIYRESSRATYELAQIEMPWTTTSDVVQVDPWENTDLSGKNIRRASVAFDPNTNEPYIALEFNQEGGELFGKITEEHVGDILGIFLDGAPISTPQIQQAIYGGSATIVGDFTVLEAKDLVRRLNAGALPVPIKLIGQQTVGPTLGLISLEKSVNAALFGFFFVALFMILYYRLAGVVSVISLLIYTLLNLVVYKALGMTMTLAGIAGLILSIGIAADANVLMFERLKEELKAGRDLHTAVDEGFRRAWNSIRDGNATTLVASVVLFAFSTSFVKGFALALGLGVLLSLFTAAVITRSILLAISQIKAFHAHAWYGVKK
jgi:protein-export membrane protein SecD